MYDKNRYLAEAAILAFTEGFPFSMRVGFWETRFTQDIARDLREAGYTVQVNKHNYFMELILDAGNLPSV